MENKKKYYDDMLKNDRKGQFLIEYSSQCFNQCVSNINTEVLNSEEKNCFLDCYAKGYYTFIQTNNIFK
jgi:hypothetical protein